MPEIETANKFLVGVRGDNELTILKLGCKMKPDDALNLAAWLVALAEDNASYKFEEILKAVQET